MFLSVDEVAQQVLVDVKAVEEGHFHRAIEQLAELVVLEEAVAAHLEEHAHRLAADDIRIDDEVGIDRHRITIEPGQRAAFTRTDLEIGAGAERLHDKGHEGHIMLADMAEDARAALGLGVIAFSGRCLSVFSLWHVDGLRMAR